MNAAWTDTRSALPTRFVAAAIGASGVVGLTSLLVILGPPLRSEELLPVLVAAGGLCLAVLVRRRVPGLAWASLVAAALVAAGVPIALSRAADPAAIGLGAWLAVAGRSSAAAIVTLAIAGLYATRPERQAVRHVTAIAWLLLAWLSAGCLITMVLVIVGAPVDPELTWVDIATGPTSLFVDLVLLLAVLGVVGDVRAATVRADARLAAAGASGRVSFAERLRTTLRELVPGEADAGAAAVDAERARLAGDLHAVVLPSLRRAIAEVEAGAPAETLAERLRTVDLELERIMADRWPVVLETFGLVEALEDLAERIEAEVGIRIVLEIDGVADRPRPEIERTAWRMAQVALDNAVRHAAATEITIRLSIAADRVRLEISDDGRGLDAATADGAMRSGARGLADLTRRASAVGGSVAIEAGRPVGTVVRFDWPANA